MPTESFSQLKGNLEITLRADQTGGNLFVNGSATIGNLFVGGVSFENKADKVDSATAGHLAAFDASGNLADSGFAASDFAEAEHVHAIADVSGAGTAAALDAGTGAGNLPVLDADGKLSTGVLPSGTFWATHMRSGPVVNITLADQNRYYVTDASIFALSINTASLIGEAVVTFTNDGGHIDSISGLDAATMLGDDCHGGIFAPLTGKTYTIRFYGDAARVVGNVTGVASFLVTPVASTAPTVTLEYGKRFNCGSLDDLTLAAGIFNLGRCQVYFKTSANWNHGIFNSLTDTTGAVWSGVNCFSGRFSPEENDEYLITFEAVSRGGVITRTAQVRRPHDEEILPMIVVSAPTGTEITVTNGTVTLTKTAENGVCSFALPAFGRWTVSGRFDDWNADSLVTLDAAEAKTYTAALTFDGLVVYGVRHYKTLSSPVLERLGDAVGKTFLRQIVTETVTGGVSSYTTEQNGVSGFDNAPIYRNIKLCNVVGGVPTAYYGENGFSFTPADGDVCIEIPRFYVRIDQTDTATTWWISNKKGAGFVTSPAHMDRGDSRGEREKIYIGRYTSNADFRSVSECASLNNTAIYLYRNGHKTRGTSYFNEDYLTWITYTILYLIETTNLNSQAVVGPGYSKSTNTGPLDNGQTDELGYHSGLVRADSTEFDNQSAVAYRWVENPWGNLRQFIDGIVFRFDTIAVFKNPDRSDNGGSASSWNGGVYADVFLSAFPTSSGYVKSAEAVQNSPAFFFPKTIGGSSSTGFCDWVYSLDTNGITSLCVGGHWMEDTSCGFFYFYGHSNFAAVSRGVGARLMILPSNP